MDCSEIQAEMAEGGQQDPLVIIEEGDELTGVTERAASSSSVAITQSCSGESARKKEEEQTGEDRNEDGVAAEMCLEHQNLEKQSTNVEDDLTGEVSVTEEDKEEKDQPGETGNLNDGQSRDDSGREGQTNDGMRINKDPEGPGGTEDDKGTQSDPEVDAETINSSEQHPEGTKSQDDLKKVCGLFLFYFRMTQLAGQALNRVFHGEFLTYLHVSHKKAIA